jgi:hypothetical protein
MGATHTHGATAEMGSAATHTHSATAEMGTTATAATEVSAAATATAAEVTAASPAAKMSTTAPTAATETAASRVSGRRQANRQAYCGRARRDFPHDMTSLSGPNAASQRRIARAVPADSKFVMLQCTRRPVRVAHH